MILWFFADAVPDSSNWLQWVVQCGALGLLAALLVWYGPLLLKHLEEKDKAHYEQIKAMEEQHRAERSEERQQFTAVIERNTSALSALKDCWVQLRN